MTVLIENSAKRSTGGGGGGGGKGKGGEGWCRSSMLTRIDTSFQPSSPSHLERHPSRGKTWL